MRLFSSASAVLALLVFNASLFATDAPARRKSPAVSQQSAAGKGVAGKRLASPAWPFLRGPNYDGHAADTSLVDEFPPQGPPVLWTRPLGVGYSSFSSDGDRVFTQYQTLASQYVLAIDSLTGKTVWEYAYELAYDPAGLYPGPRATPTVVNGRVYFAAPSGLLGSLDAATGRFLWSFNVFERFDVKPVEFGFSCSPTVIDNKIVVPVGAPNASLVAFDAQTGETLWRAGNDPISHVPCMPIELAGRRLVIGYLRNALLACDLQTGEIVGRTKLSQGYDEHAAWPIYREPCLWLSGPFQQGSELLELSVEPFRFHTRWKSRLLSNDVCSSVLVDGFLYGFDIRDPQTKPHRPSRGQFRCLEFATGEQRWANGPARRIPRDVDDPEPELQADEAPAAAIGQANVLYADGKLILFNDTGELILVRATPDRYEELARARVLGGEICWTLPMLVGGRLYVRNHSRAACVVLGAADPDRPAAAPRLTVADIPQSVYRDWASNLLAVEPEYMMDLPTPAQLASWFVASLLSFAAAVATAGLGAAVLAGFRRYRFGAAKDPVDGRVGNIDCSELTSTERRIRWFRGAYRTLAVVAGGLGTTFLSKWSGQFIFTWPLCLFVIFSVIVDRAGSRTNRDSRKRWLDRLLLCAFSAIFAGYFLLCRRLSLGFEWVFLSGFVAAAPPLVWARNHHRIGWWASLGVVALEALAFAIYYGASIAILFARYRA